MEFIYLINQKLFTMNDKIVSQMKRNPVLVTPLNFLGTTPYKIAYLKG